MTATQNHRVQILLVAEFYHITPDEARKMPFDDFALTLEIINVRNRIQDFKTKKRN